MPFTASIVDRSFIDIPDKVLCLGGAAFLRKLPVGTMPWSRIRIGLICAVTPNGTSNIPDTQFTVGICSGQEYPGSAYSTINYLGASMAGGTRLLTYNAAGPYYSCSLGTFFKKEESIITAATTGFATAVSLAPASTGRYRRRTLLVIDITKTQGETGAVTMALYGPSAALCQTTDYRPDDLQSALDSLGTPTIRDQALTQLEIDSTINYSPVLGDIDTLEIFWSNATFPLEISALGAVILSEAFYASAGTSAVLGAAIDTFETYTVNGSVSTTLLTGGSGWANTGFVYNASGTSNLAPQVYTQYVGTTYSPDETFQQYATGTVDSGTTVNLGTYWTSPAAMVSITANLVPQVYVALAGSNLGAYDSFESYGTGVVVSGVTINGSGSWSSAGSIY